MSSKRPVLNPTYRQFNPREVTFMIREYFVVGHTAARIARAMGRSVGTVQGYIARCKRNYDIRDIERISGSRRATFDKRRLLPLALKEGWSDND